MVLKAVIQWQTGIDCVAKAEDFEAETKSCGEELKAPAEAKRVIREAIGGAEDRVRLDSVVILPALAHCL